MFYLKNGCSLLLSRVWLRRIQVCFSSPRQWQCSQWTANFSSNLNSCSERLSEGIQKKVKLEEKTIGVTLIWPWSLHTNCPVFIRSCMHSVLHASCPASGPARILSCMHRVPHPVLHASCPASGPACILSCTHRVLHASCPASALSCIKNKILFRIFLNINNDKRFNFYVNE